jgi:glucan biosynthesis protein
MAAAKRYKYLTPMRYTDIASMRYTDIASIRYKTKVKGLWSNGMIAFKIDFHQFHFNIHKEINFNSERNNL